MQQAPASSLFQIDVEILTKMAPIRLLDVDTFEVKDSYSLAEQAFHPHTANADAEIKYGIVSHKWLTPNSREVQFDDLRDAASRSTAKEKKRTGFAKITETCELAKARGLQYIWLDTCCINKTNPTEVQESINSMYSWYQEARVCFVYLAGTNAVDTLVSIKRDEWFTRSVLSLLVQICLELLIITEFELIFSLYR